MTHSRCFLVYALAPESLSAREANDTVNAYISDLRRGVVVYHDHFTGGAHGGLAVFEVRDESEEALLAELGPLEGWRVEVHALTFSLSAVGFVEQAALTVREYARTTLETLREEEPDDPRYWWRRRA